MMFRVLLLMVFLAFSNVALATTDDQAFLSILPDVPLMQGFVELEDSAMAFDKPQGRIVLMEAQGDLKSDHVMRYYQDILPRLGWQQVKTGIFTREKEQLTVHVDANDEITSIKFLLEPR